MWTYVDIFYVTMATIIMNNMMVEERIRNDELERTDVYEIGSFFDLTNNGEDVNSSDEENGSIEDNIVGNLIFLMFMTVY